MHGWAKWPQRRRTPATEANVAQGNLGRSRKYQEKARPAYEIMFRVHDEGKQRKREGEGAGGGAGSGACFG
eukprot:99652-Pleurochrysis_carterae.AAC.1